MLDTASSNKKPLILIVDDDLFMRVTFQHALEDAGFKTVVASDGISAITSYKNLQPDLIVLDLVMPGKDGFETCQEIRGIPGGLYTPVLMVTSLEDTGSIRSAFEAGATDFISKPVNPDLLAYRVRYMLRASQSIKTLADSEAKLANAQRIAQLGNWEWDPAGNSFRGSGEVFRILGMETSPQPLNLESFLFTIYTPDREVVDSRLKNACRNNSSCCFEFRIKRSDTELRVVRLQAFPGEIAQGGFRRIAGTLQDITDIRQVEDQLKMLKESIDCLPIGITVSDIHGRIIYSNPAEAEIHGYSIEELVDIEARQFAPPGFAKPLTQEELCNSGLWKRESINVKKNGEEFPVQLTSVAARNIEGRCIGILTACEDITERKKAENELENTLSLLNATLESTADGILVHDLTGKIITFNKKFAEMWRIPESLLATSDDKHMRSSIVDHLKDPGKYLETTEIQYIRPGIECQDVLDFKDGRVFEWFSKPQIIENKIVGRVISLRDITERKNLEAQLRHSQKMEAIGTMAGGIAHDFNNSLTAIIGFGYLAEMKMAKDDPLRKNMEQLLAAADKAANLTRSLLAFSRKQSLNPQPENLCKIVRNLGKLLERIIGEDIHLLTRFTEENLNIYADSGQIEQVLMNLAANARDAMPDGGALEIEMATVNLDETFIHFHGYGEPGRYALLTVSDSGTGMDKETLQRIFEPFFTTKEVGKGTGLGLSIIYGIIKQHNGYINVYSEPNQGTTFKIYLPLIEAGSQENVKVSLPYPGRGTETILVAEDDPFTRSVVTSILKEFGYSLIEAEDGEDAVKKFKENRDSIQFLLIDMIMPKKNGREAFEEISKMCPGIRALFFSGYTAGFIKENKNLGEGVDIVMKPILPVDLARKVREILDRNSPSATFEECRAD